MTESKQQYINTAEVDERLDYLTRILEELRTSDTSMPTKVLVAKFSENDKSASPNPKKSRVIREAIQLGLDKGEIIFSDGLQIAQ